MSNAVLTTLAFLLCAAIGGALCVPLSCATRRSTIDVAAVRSAFDQMLVGKGLVTPTQLDLIRNGTRARGVVTAMTVTGTACEDHREVELDLMVSRPAGGQFPAHQTALIPQSALEGVTPGCLVDAYYRTGDESAVAVCVPPG